jgi:hypothetical protein
MNLLACVFQCAAMVWYTSQGRTGSSNSVLCIALISASGDNLALHSVGVIHITSNQGTKDRSVAPIIHSSLGTCKDLHAKRSCHTHEYTQGLLRCKGASCPRCLAVAYTICCSEELHVQHGSSNVQHSMCTKEN